MKIDWDMGIAIPFYELKKTKRRDAEAQRVLWNKTNVLFFELELDLALVLYYLDMGRVIPLGL